MIKTERLILRDWTERDAKPFAEMNADPRVMEYFPKLLGKDESDNMIKNFQLHQAKHGYSFWAAEEKDSGSFIGFVGFANVLFKSKFTPAVEIGWRLAYPFWGKGYATEAAKACLNYGFQEIGFKEIVSFTTQNNQRSRNVMTKIGMSHDPKKDFDHPLVSKDSPLLKHVLYSITSHSKGT